MRIVGWLRNKSTLASGHFQPLQARIRSWRGALAPSLPQGRELLALVASAFSNSFFVGGISITGTAAVLFLVPMFTSPFHWLPEPENTLSLLGPLLGAQAAVAALTLAVTVFVVQGVSNKGDADDRTYREYVRRSRAEWVLWGSLGAAAITGAVLLGHRFISGTPAVLDAAQGLPNLTLVAVAALFGNLVLPGILFRHAIRLARPDEWRALRLDVDKRDVRAAVQAFLGRSRRAAAALEANEPDLSTVFPDLGEDAGNEAIRTILGDARRAMAERRHGDFTRAFDSIKELVEHAMGELRREGIAWDRPCSQPQWPPLHRLGEDIRSFREDVIGRGNMDYIYPILVLDHWLLINGIRERCGEMFTASLDGYRANCEIARRVATGELRDILRDRLWGVADGAIYGIAPEDAFPYIREMVAHQTRLLSDAMLADSPSDFAELNEGFEGLLQAVRLHWRVKDWLGPEGAALLDQLGRDYRIALMELGGRAVLLADSDRIADPAPFRAIADNVYNDAKLLAADAAEALLTEKRRGLSMGMDWEREGARSFQVYSIKPEQYPLTFFAIRLLELITDDMPPLNVHGHAGQVLSWFEANIERLEPYVADPDRDMEERRNLAVDALQRAVRADGVAEEHDIISRNLSENRLAGFAASVYAGAFSNNAVENIFRRSDSFLYLPSDADGAPEERGIRQFEQKVFLAEEREGAITSYGALECEELGWGLSDDVIDLLCAELEDASSSTSPLDTPQVLLRAIDEAAEQLGGSGELLVVLAGDWDESLHQLAVEQPAAYEPLGRIPEADRVGEVARYRGNPIVTGPEGFERGLYVLEPAAWGCFVRAQVEGSEDILVEVHPISAERAQELLDDNPHHFPDEPDPASKLRMLQTLVEVGVAARVGFRVVDPSRAHRITDA